MAKEPTKTKGKPGRPRKTTAARAVRSYTRRAVAAAAPDADVEQVDHPGHYGGADNPHEVIKVLESWLTPEEYIGFLKGNSLKYMARHRAKGGRLSLQKGLWYQVELDRFLEATGADVG